MRILKHALGLLLATFLTLCFTFKVSNPSAKSDYITTTSEDTTKPEFIGGDEAYYNFLNDNLMYPELAIKKNHTGKTIVQFVIEKDSSVSEVEVYKSSGYNELDKEALRVVNLTNGKWKPASVNDTLVRSKAHIPITFELFDE